MGILTGPEIERLVNRTRGFIKVDLSPPLPSIVIEPFDPSLAGPNSYDIHLSPELRVYRLASVRRAHPELFKDFNDDAVLADGVDARVDNPTISFNIPDDGMWLHPDVLYLAATVEHTKCEGLTPWLDGRSSIGRLGLSVHVTAGRGDDGWSGRWTCEVTAVAHPIKVYPRMRIGQITFFTMTGERRPYTGRYQDQQGPTSSRYHLEDGNERTEPPPT